MRRGRKRTRSAHGISSDLPSHRPGTIQASPTQAPVPLLPSGHALPTPTWTLEPRPALLTPAHYVTRGTRCRSPAATSASGAATALLLPFHLVPPHPRGASWPMNGAAARTMRQLEPPVLRREGRREGRGDRQAPGGRARGEGGVLVICLLPCPACGA